MYQCKHAHGRPVPLHLIMCQGKHCKEKGHGGANSCSPPQSCTHGYTVPLWTASLCTRECIPCVAIPSLTAQTSTTLIFLSHTQPHLLLWVQECSMSCKPAHTDTHTLSVHTHTQTDRRMDMHVNSPACTSLGFKCSQPISFAVEINQPTSCAHTLMTQSTT